MADQGKWFKLWCSSLTDSSLANLPNEDWARWAKLGAYIKMHGTDGKLVVESPAIVLQHLFQVGNFEAVVSALKRFPNCNVGESEATVSLERYTTVSLTIEYTNWHKYQSDLSSTRVRNFRARKRLSETIQEEKRSRREENKKRGEEISISSAPDSRISKLIGIFFDGLKLKVGEKPVFNGGEAGRTLKSLLLTFSEQDIQGRIAAWFQSDDPFIVKMGWRFSMFHINFNKLKGGPIHATRTDKTSGNVRNVSGDAEREKAYSD